jgi:hypothetical protein
MEPYKNFASYLRKKYGQRVQKISINLPFSCPNRNDKKGLYGCIYCDNISFLPEYTLNQKSVSDQINEGINYFQKKYPSQLYIAYFQNYTNTYASPEILYNTYMQACEHEKVVALSIATRPDCINDDIINVLKEISKIKQVFIEIGIETTYDKTLFIINRCHKYIDVINAVKKLKENNFWVTGHLIFGLPDENIFDVIQHAKNISALQIQCIKLHQLQILKNTPLHRIYENNKEFVKPLSLQEYINWAILFLEHLSPEIYIERFTSESPKDRVIEPKWNQIKNYQVVEIIKRQMKKNNTYQGIKFFSP